MRQWLQKYSKQEWMMLLLFIMLLIWLFTIISTGKSQGEEDFKQQVKDVREEIVYSHFNI